MTDEIRIDEYKEHPRITISNIIYIYKRISVGKYIEINNASTDTLSKQDAIVMEALLYPKLNARQLDRMLAGEFQRLYNAIIESSKLDTSKWIEDIDSRKAKLKPVDSNGYYGFAEPLMPIILQICKVFGYKPEDVFKMDADAILDRFAWSELLLNNIEPEQPTKQHPTNNIQNIQPKNTKGPKKWQYTEEELRQISADVSEEALNEHMSKVKKR